MTKKKGVPDWERCEIEKRLEYSGRGCKVATTGKGSDFLAICPDEKPTLVEVKKGCRPLTKFQRRTMNEAHKKGLGYKVERCGCSKGARRKSQS